MFESETQSLLQRVLSQLSLEFSPVFNAIRVPLALMIIERKNKRHSKVDHLITVASNILFLIKSSFVNNLSFKKIKPVNQKFVFIIDHNREPLINVFLEIIKGIPIDEVCIVTINRSIYKILINKTKYKVIYADNFATFNLNDLKFIRRVRALILKIDSNMPLFDRLSVFINLIKVVSYEQFHKKLLSNEISSVLTLCDANLHENVVARVANEKKIETTTLQHGVPNILWFPVISNNFFVWNEHTKSICKERFGVHESKMRVLGNPIFQKNKVEEKKNKVFTITYIVSNWGEIENRKLFEVFLRATSHKDIKLIVKLRPNPPFRMLSLYESWIKSYKDHNIEIMYKEDINNILAQTDLVVTFHSGVPVDAMSYKIPSILLDIFDYIDLKELMGHYEDCLVVKNEEDYIEMIRKILTDRDYYSTLVKGVENIKPKYFLNKSRDEVIEAVRSNLPGYKIV